MNAFKSAFGLSKSQNLQLQPLFEDVKSWDQARARFLQNHLKVVHLVMDALDKKVIQVQKYIDGLDKLMSARIEEITSYCKNGVNDSQFFLVPSSLNSLKPCHQLLKHLLMQESQRELNLSKKGSTLSIILEKLKKLKSAECSQANESAESEGDAIRMIKSSIRFLIDCQLADLIQEALASCKQVSVAYYEQKDFYLAVENFVKVADKQLKMHQEIGRQLLKLVLTFSEREKQLRQRLREILLQWIKEDFQDKIFHQQLSKKCSQDLVNDFYDIQNLIPEKSALWGGQSLSQYLQNFNILPFRQHQRLVVYSRQVFYNGKVDAKVVLTQMKQAYLFRIQSNKPDFNFCLSKNLKLKKSSPLILQVRQTHKTLLLREEADFQFILQFNLEADLKQFEQKCMNSGCQLQKK